MIAALLILAATAAPMDVDTFFKEHPRQAIEALSEVATTQQMVALRAKVIQLEATERALRMRMKLVALGYAEDAAIVTACTPERFTFTAGKRKLVGLFRKHYPALRPLIASALSSQAKAALLARARKWLRWEELRALRESVEFDATLDAEFDVEIAANTPAIK